MLSETVKKKKKAAALLAVWSLRSGSVRVQQFDIRTKTVEEVRQISDKLKSVYVSLGGGGWGGGIGRSESIPLIRKVNMSTDYDSFFHPEVT